MTPNWYDQAKKALDDMRAKYASTGAANPIPGPFLPLVRLPIEPGQDAETDEQRAAG